MTVYVVGLDGVPPALLNRGINSGYLPAFEKILEEGVEGKTRSTTPPVSMMAWSTFATGKKPGNHGIFNFLIKEASGYDTDFATRSLLEASATPIWDYLDAEGIESGVMNIMPGYPPSKSLGFHIADHITTPPNGKYTHPESLQDRITNKFEKFRLGPLTGYSPGDGEEALNNYVKKFFSIEKERVELGKYLVQENNCPMMAIVFSAPDIFLHEIGHLLYEDHPKYDQELAQKNNKLPMRLLNLYDSFLSWLTDQMEGDDSILILSDHGHGPIHKAINLNSWLYQNGYLTLKNRPSTVLKKYGYNYLYESVERLMKKFKIYEAIKQGIAHASNTDSGVDLSKLLTIQSSDIKWSETEAFTVAGDGQVYINSTKHRDGKVAPAEYEKLRSELASRLKKMEDPETGELILSEVHYGGDLYEGKQSDQRPDLICIPKPTYRIKFPQTMRTSNHIVLPQKYGGHSSKDELFGIFAAYGESIRKEEGVTMSLEDFVPTIMMLMGLPIPKEVDGECRTEITTKSSEVVSKDYTGRIKSKEAVRTVVENLR